MLFPAPLQEGILIKRYKRFLADVECKSGEVITIHCPNTGSMKNCQQPGSRVWYTDSGNLKRKYPCTWQLIEMNGEHLVGINTGLANHLIEEAIQNSTIAELQGYDSIRREVPYGEQRSRIDLMLENQGDSERCFVEVKNVSLGLGHGLGVFPDSVTTRGQKHLQELAAMRRAGDRAVLVFCVQHEGIAEVRPADDIDPDYGRLLREVAAAGVEVLAFAVSMHLVDNEIKISRRLPVNLQ